MCQRWNSSLQRVDEQQVNICIPTHPKPYQEWIFNYGDTDVACAAVLMKGLKLYRHNRCESSAHFYYTVSSTQCYCIVYSFTCMLQLIKHEASPCKTDQTLSTVSEHSVKQTWHEFTAFQRQTEPRLRLVSCHSLHIHYDSWHELFYLVHICSNNYFLSMEAPLYSQRKFIVRVAFIIGFH